MGDRAPGVVGGGFVDPVDPFGWVEPAVAEFDEAAGCLGDGDGARVAGVAGGGEVGREAFGEGEGLEGGRGIVGRVITHAVPATQPKRPRFMKPAVKNTEGCVVVAGNHNDSGIRAYPSIRPDE